jgi:hypothetical protein
VDTVHQGDLDGINGVYHLNAVDEVTQWQVVGAVHPASPAKPGREARRDNEYGRCGTANVCCAVAPKAGRHFTFPTPDRSAFEFAQVAVTLALAYPEAKTIHLVMDNLNIHCRKSLADVYSAEMAAEVWNRFTVHHTPMHGSWLESSGD